MIKEFSDIDYLNTLSDYKITINPYNKILIFELDEVVAFIDYSIIYENIEINYIYVKETYRRKGIATKLLNYIIDRNTTLEVNILNKEAINLYKKLGFQIVAIRKRYYNGIDGYLMRRSYENISN